MLVFPKIVYNIPPVATLFSVYQLKKNKNQVQSCDKCEIWKKHFKASWWILTLRPQVWPIATRWKHRQQPFSCLLTGGGHGSSKRRTDTRAAELWTKSRPGSQMSGEEEERERAALSQLWIVKLLTGRWVSLWSVTFRFNDMERILPRWDTGTKTTVPFNV